MFIVITSSERYFNLKQSDYQKENTMSIDKIGVLQELFKLQQISLLNSGNVIFGLTNIIPEDDQLLDKEFR